jgi:hypothetical protein
LCAVHCGGRSGVEAAQGPAANTAQHRSQAIPAIMRLTVPWTGPETDQRTVHW